MLRRKEITDPYQHQCKLDVVTSSDWGGAVSSRSQGCERLRAAPEHSLATAR